MATIEERVRSLVAQQLGVKDEEVKDGSHFVDDLGADSVDIVELLMALEEEFEKEIPDQEGGEHHHRSSCHRLRQSPPGITGRPAMTRIEEDVIRVVADQLGIPEEAVSAESSFVSDLHIDARQSARLRRQIEQQLEIELPKGDAKDLTTVGDMIAYVEEHTS